MERTASRLLTPKDWITQGSRKWTRSNPSRIVLLDSLWHSHQDCPEIIFGRGEVVHK